MRRLIFLRHAKAMPSGMGGDRARDLEPRGLREAAAAGDMIAAAGLAPEVALVSDALRTRRTYEAVAARLGTAPRLHLEAALYDASPDAILAAIAATAADVMCLLVIGHNPGLAQTAQRLSRTGPPDERARLARGFPTAAAAVIILGAPWRHVADGGALDALLLP